MFAFENICPDSNKMINLIPKYATGCSPLACVQTSAISFVVQETSARVLFSLGLLISNYKKLIVYNKSRRKWR